MVDSSQISMVVLTIDVEPDNAWKDHRNPSIANVAQLLRLQEILSRYGAKATCLVTRRIIQDTWARGILQELVGHGGAEIGTHLHPWESEPFMNSGLDVRYPMYPHELSRELFTEKLSRLTNAIAEHFEAPRSYRAGRWGMAGEHLPILEQLGYEVDSSVTPLIDWRNTMGVPFHCNGRGGVDYRLAPPYPYQPDYMDVTRPGKAGIVEVPLTVGYPWRTPRFVRWAYGRLPRRLCRVLEKTRLAKPVWATPTEEKEEPLKKMLAAVLREDTPIINLAIHSSELAVGGSPWSATVADVEGIFQKIISILDLLVSCGSCRFETLTAAARRWQGLPKPASPSAEDKHPASTRHQPV